MSILLSEYFSVYFLLYTYVCNSVLEIRMRNWSAIFKSWTFYRLIHCCPIENIWEIWPIKIDFGRPNAEIGWKMASGRLLFLALVIVYVFLVNFTKNHESYMLIHSCYWGG